MNLRRLLRYLESSLLKVYKRDATHYLKVGASVSSQLRFSQKVNRLSVAPPLGRYSESDRFYQVLYPAHPGLNNKVCGSGTRHKVITPLTTYMNATDNNDVGQGLTCHIPCHW